MINKYLLLIDNKLSIIKLQILKYDDKIIINNINKNKLNSIIKIPIYNKYQGINYVPILFPLELKIINDKIYSPYIIYSSYNIITDNDIDFFNKLNKDLIDNYKLELMKISDIKDIIEIKYEENINIINIWKNILNLKNEIIINEILKKENKYKIEYDLFNINDKMTLRQYLDYNYLETIENKEINHNYYIVNNERISYIKINNNMILNNNKLYKYNPNIKIDNEYIIYNTIINDEFEYNIIKILLDIEEKKIKNLQKYIYVDNKDDYYYLNTINLENSNYSNEYILEYLNENNYINVLNILFKKYNYPLSYNRHDIDNIFDNILYISFKYINKMINNNEIIPEIIEIIPNKLKILYINIIKLYYNLLSNNYTLILYNQKYYNDYLHKTILKILLSNSNKQSIKYFRNTLNINTINKLIYIYSTNILLIDISNRLNWNILSKKLNYLILYYNNKDIIFYQNKLNKNIIPENFDNRIKKIIENPFEMYKYLRYEYDFIKWTQFISNYINNLYIIPITLIIDDYINIGKIIYLLYNIKNQSITDEHYKSLLNICNKNQKLILNYNCDRINMKIKELLPNLKTNINLGYLAKHIISEKNNIIIINKNYIELENELNIMKHKYMKYKLKYLQIKDKTNNIINSETSAVLS
jgi:hypothetical protein